jgi:membrane protease YdiL (CAAX protease family)
MFSKNVYRIVTAIVIGMIIFLASNIISVLNVGIPRLVIVQFSMLFLTFLTILILGKGHISVYGFQKPRNIKWARMIVIALALGVGQTLIAVLLGSRGMSGLNKLSFVQILLIVLILASVTEEMLCRGLIQSYLAPLNAIKVKLLMVEFDVPTVIGALFFGAMHIIVLISGTDLMTSVIVIIFAFLLGLLAGYNRAQSQSLVPAIVLHATANIGGVIGGILVTMMKVLVTGKPPIL